MEVILDDNLFKGMIPLIRFYEGHGYFPHPLWTHLSAYPRLFIKPLAMDARRLHVILLRSLLSS